MVFIFLTPPFDETAERDSEKRGKIHQHIGVTSICERAIALFILD